MDKKELEEGLKDAEENAEKDSGKSEGAAPEEWLPNLEWLMKSVGPFFNNNAGLGELLIDKLNESGVNTEGAALSAVVDVLQQFNREYKSLGEAIGSNLDKIDELSSQSEDLASALEGLLKDMGVETGEGSGVSLDGAEAMPPDMGAAPPADMGGGMPADMGAAPPADMGGGMPADMGAAPPADMGGGMPADMGAAPPAGVGGGMPPDMGAMPPGTVSDENLKDTKKYVLSDEQMKNVAHKLVGAYYRRKNAGRRTSLSPDIIGACKRKDLGSDAPPSTGDDDEG